MSALDRNPTSTDLLQPTKFLLTFGRIKETQFFCQRVNIPGVSIVDIESPTTFANLKIPGNKITYDSFEIEFLVDNNLSSWRNIYEWIVGLSIPHNFDEYRLLNRQNKNTVFEKQPQYSDATVTILNGLNNPKLRIVFDNIFPKSISSINFDTQLSAETIITASASFSFTNYKIEIL